MLLLPNSSSHTVSLGTKKMAIFLRCVSLGLLVVLVSGATYDPNTDNLFEFNAGTCHNTDCSCNTKCCDTSSLFEIFEDYYNPAKAADPPGAPNASGIIDDQTIGFGPDFNVAGAQICDHANDSTAVFKSPFLYDGTVSHVTWYINHDCTDDGVALRTGAHNNFKLTFGIFEAEPGVDNSYRLLNYISLNRSEWYDSKLTTGVMTAGQGVKFTYYLTKEDRQTLQIDDCLIKDLYFGFGWSYGGAVAYQNWQNAWDGQDVMAIYDDQQFAPWDQLSLPTNYESTGVMGLKQKGRHYNMHVTYVPYQGPGTCF